LDILKLGYLDLVITLKKAAPRLKLYQKSKPILSVIKTLIRVSLDPHESVNSGPGFELKYATNLGSKAELSLIDTKYGMAIKKIEHIATPKMMKFEIKFCVDINIEGELLYFSRLASLETRENVNLLAGTKYKRCLVITDPRPAKTLVSGRVYGKIEVSPNEYKKLFSARDRLKWVVISAIS
jgi:hypothetical protein